jgi:hypothetical protein
MPGESCGAEGSTATDSLLTPVFKAPTAFLL